MIENQNTFSTIIILLDDYKKHYKNGVLNLSFQRLTDNDIPALCHFLRQHPEITNLNLSVNNIGSIGAKMLSDNHTLLSLNISWNNLGQEGAEAFKDNDTLTNLDISWNKIGDAGAEFLSKNHTITSLIIVGNGIGNPGVDALKKNRTFTMIDIDSFEINYRLTDEIATQVRNNITTQKKQYANLVRYSRLYGQVLEKNKTHDRNRFLAQQIFKLTANSIFFGGHEKQQNKKMNEIMEKHSARPTKENQFKK